jgi:hypothetical protein
MSASVSGVGAQAFTCADRFTIILFLRAFKTLGSDKKIAASSPDLFYMIINPRSQNIDFPVNFKEYDNYGS